MSIALNYPPGALSSSTKTQKTNLAAAPLDTMNVLISALGVEIGQHTRHGAPRWVSTKNFATGAVSAVSFGSICAVGHQSQTISLREIATEAIGNLTKVRNTLGIELAGAWQGQSDAEIEDLLTEEGLVRRPMDSTDLAKKIELLRRHLPDVDWDAELISDALFVDSASVFEALDHLRRVGP